MSQRSCAPAVRVPGSFVCRRQMCVRPWSELSKATLPSIAVSVMKPAPCAGTSTCLSIPRTCATGTDSIQRSRPGTFLRSYPRFQEVEHVGGTRDPKHWDEERTVRCRGCQEPAEV